ncbi:MAG: glycosyltransferase family 4 protein, partial [Balneolaceae bacterium]
RNDVSRIMLCADVFVFPSIFEGFGLAALEANACFLPVVGSKIDGITEAVKDKVTGFLHKTDDYKSMAESVLTLINNQSLRKKMGLAGRKRAEKNFSLKLSISNLRRYYDECLGYS